MTLPTNKRAEWTQRRIEQAYAAAEAGEGWTALGRLWETSNAGALMWARTHLPKDVLRKIGENGLKAKVSTRGRRLYEYAKPAIVKTPPTMARTEACQFKWLDAGELVQCGEPTGGKTYCQACDQYRATQPAGSRYAYNPGHGPTPQKAA